MNDNNDTQIVKNPIVDDIHVGDTSVTIHGSSQQRATLTFQNGVTIDGLINENDKVKLVIPKYIKIKAGDKVKVQLKDGYRQSENIEFEVKKIDIKPKVIKPKSEDIKKVSRKPKLKNINFPKIEMNDKNIRFVRYLLLVVVSILLFILIITFGAKSSEIKAIEKIGYSNEEATLIYEACEDKKQCAHDVETQINSEIKTIEDAILATYQIEVVNYDVNYQQSSYNSKIEYKNGLMEYQQVLNSQQTVNQIPEVAQTPDENGCYVNMVNGYIVANKKYCLPPSYDPGTNQEAYDQLLKMISDANSQGIYITILSGYRSYEDQVETYDYWVSIYGEEYASTISAKPGYSEHQTGLAFDLGDANNPYCDLEECFESTEAGIWLAQHAHEYGFIIRYPKGSEAITGYAYEPWHFRYVGDIATDIYEQQTTLEEYLQVP
jgi:LAS superfamily LD-carboxypeptidase LdcB